jgi:hypothetical protein
MSQLARLLQVDDRLFDNAIAALNTSRGHRSVDAKLVGDLHEAAARAMLNLGLDPKNTTGPELYRAFGNRFATDFKQLLKTEKFSEATLKKLGKSQGYPQFWQDTLWVGAIYGAAPVSFNIFDIMADFKANAAYNIRRSANLRDALADELLKRYAAEPGISRVLIDKLERVIVESKDNSKKENK